MKTFYAFIAALVATATVTWASGIGVTSPPSVQTSASLTFIDAGTIYTPGNLTVDGTEFLTASGTAMRFTGGGTLDLTTSGAGGFKSAGGNTVVIGTQPFTPNTDQAINLGSSSVRWSNIYAGVLNLIAGSSTAMGVANSTLTVNTSAVGNAADTTEDNLQTYSFLANGLNANGKCIRYTAWGSGASTTDVTTVKCYFGATVVVSKVLTASQANTWRMVYNVCRTGATAQIATGEISNGGTAGSIQQGNASPGETLSGNVTIKCTGQRTITSSANSVQQLGGIVETVN